MKGYCKVLLLTLLFATGCNQYICYDGTYVEDPYSCFSHGGLSWYKAQRKASVPSGYQGTWNMSLQTTQNTCPSIPKSISRKVTISQKSGSMTASIAGTGRYNGRMTGRRARFVGTDSSLCKADYDITTDFTNTAKGTVNGTIKASCFSLLNCSVSFKGTISR